MSDTQAQTFVIILVVVILLVLLCFCALMIIAQRLARIENVLRTGKAEGVGETKKSTRAEERSGAFEKFLAGQPELRLRPKSEQFAAFRKWRKDQGLNWEAK